MTRTQLSCLLAAGFMLLCAGSASATVTDAAAKPAAAGSAPLSTSIKATHKPVAKVKLVDINSANKAALIKLPGITDPLADKIIAGRPYGSKAWLVSNNVIDTVAYDSIKALIEAKMPFKDGAKNVAYIEKMKKEKAAKP